MNMQHGYIIDFGYWYCIHDVIYSFAYTGTVLNKTCQIVCFRPMHIYLGFPVSCTVFIRFIKNPSIPLNAILQRQAKMDALKKKDKSKVTKKEA